MSGATLRILCLLPMLCGSLTAVAAGGRAEIPLQAGGAFSVPLVSMKEIRFQKTIHQQYDFSCGSAALATLLTHHYNFPVTEQAVFREMFERGDKVKIRKEGFSLLDIKNYLAARGFDSDGYVADVEKLNIAKVPAITLIKERGYHHFVVIKGLRDGRILIGDPSSGTRAMPQQQFKEMWVNNILFVIKNKTNLARFNGADDWRAAPRSPVADGVYRGGAESGFAKRGPADF